ncbi:hypothetical protein SeMB42_g06558 [Synchytrium endobioticum]|uniref:Exonuclease 1 n=1 Tax=Synchytrium endobioticum TaxID=286115 RepID=A0A507CLF7_9FUNG|nr:hypothetical protein SeMB42_g06558 [Synchytrium endobioticum]
MGIQGLLPLLSKICEPIHLSDLKGLTVAVDSYVWLHRAAFGCAQDLALGNPTTRYVGFVVRKMEQLRDHGIHPIMVFDGGPLPMKAGTEAERRRRREETRARGLALLKEGKAQQALECFQTSVDVTPQMAWKVIQELKRLHVEYIVAPYEADAQLAYLSRTNRVSAVITEDSDLVVFGCNRVIFKLDATGSGIQIRQSRLNEVFPRFWTHEKIRHMCILSGCDYLESLPGMGLKTAQKKLLNFENGYQFLRNCINLGPALTKVTVPKEYTERFRRADLTFLYQRVYDQNERQVVSLHPIPSDFEDELSDATFIGPNIDAGMARAIAEALVDPITKLYFESGIPKTPKTPKRVGSAYIGKSKNTEKENQERKNVMSSPSVLSDASDTPTGTKKRAAESLYGKPRKMLRQGAVKEPVTWFKSEETKSTYFQTPVNDDYNDGNEEDKGEKIVAQPFATSRSNSAAGKAAFVNSPQPRVKPEASKTAFLFKKPQPSTPLPPSIAVKSRKTSSTSRKTAIKAKPSTDPTTIRQARRLKCLWLRLSHSKELK